MRLYNSPKQPTLQVPIEQYKKTSRLFNLLSASFAFFLWGGWAYYLNGSSQENTGLISGIAQGTASFFITLCMVHVVTFLYHHLSPNKWRIWLPALLTVSVTGSGLVCMHYWLGTPHIFYTISPALTVAFIFCLFTTQKLRQVNKEKGD